MSLIIAGFLALAGLKSIKNYENSTKQRCSADLRSVH